MALYHTRVIHWPLKIGDHVGFIRNPFFEYEIDPIFEVLAVAEANFTLNLKCVRSSFLAIGTIYENQPLRGLRKVKLTPIGDDLTYDFSAY